MRSTTPGGTPPRDFIALGEQQQRQQQQQQQPNATAPAPDTSAILKALADMAKQSTTSAPTTSGIPAPGSSNNVPSTQNAFPQNVSSTVNQVPTLPPPAQAVNVQGGPNFAAQFAGLSNAAAQIPNQSPTPANAPGQPLGQIASLLSAPGAGGIAPETLQQLQLLQLIQAQGVPQDQWGTVLALLMSSNNAAAVAGGANGNNAITPAWPNAAAQGAWAGRNEAESRDRNGYGDQYVQSPPGRYQQSQRRSRSPPTWDRRRDQSPPRRRDSPVYGEYSSDSRNSNRGDTYDRRGNRGRTQARGGAYRQRSPDSHRRSLSPRNDYALPPPGPKWVDYDYTIGEGMIKGTHPSSKASSSVIDWSLVLSRTLFVGGVT